MRLTTPATFCLFVRSLGKIEGDINVIARNDGKHISVTKEICVSEKSKWKLRFSDMSSFMLGSLASHVSNLRSVGVENFKITKMIPDSEKFEKVTRKGVFPYKWMTHVGCLGQTELPSKKEFFSHLNLEEVSDKDLAHAKDVWETFEMSSMREYHDLYLKTDTLLLADVFENFRNMALEKFQVDPCHYVTAPSMFCDALLKTSNAQLELVSDPEMYDFIERGSEAE